MQKRMMVPDYGFASNAKKKKKNKKKIKIRIISFFVPSVSFLVKSPYVIFNDFY